MDKKNITLFIVLFIISLSCDKDSDITTDTSFAVNIISPLDGDSISSYPMLISLSIINPQNISYIDVNLNGSKINQLYQFSNTENIAYTPPPSIEFDNIILSIYGYSNQDDSFMSDSVNINISTINQTLINNSIALLPADNFLFTKHLISNQLYSDFLNEINSLETIINSFDNNIWYDNYGKTLINIQKTHLDYNNELDLFIIQDGYESHPISGISWNGANLFATYMGWELPSVEQWQFIARGDSINWIYPYTDGYSINEAQANYGNSAGSFATTEVGSFPDNSIMGATDIVGNVWEFTKTFHPLTENYVLVGGSYQSSINNVCLNDTCFTASSPLITSSTFGFRCVTGTTYNAPILDCNNDVNNASIDICGECTGGLTGIEPNSAMDFCGECYGDGSTCEDCNGVQSGGALIDECGECTGGNTGFESNYLMDCSGVCNGDALSDECNTCDSNPNNDCIQDCAGYWGGDAFENPCGECICQTNTFNCIELDLCGCFDQNADNFICHEEIQSCYENVDFCCSISNYVQCSDYCTGDFGLFSNPLNDEDNPYFEQITHNEKYCEYWGCTDNNAVNYNSSYTNCVNGSSGPGSSCCQYYEDVNNIITIEQAIDSELSPIENLYNIVMKNNTEVGGFQITISGSSIVNVSGGAAQEAGFSLSSNEFTFLGFSLSGALISPSDTPIVLTTIEVSNDSSEICINDLVMSGEIGVGLNFVNGNSCE